LNNIGPYLLSLIVYRKYPPTRSGRTDWISIQAACGLEPGMSSVLRKNLQSGIEAIVRWIGSEEPRKDGSRESATVTRKSTRTGGQNVPTSNKPERQARAKTGVPPKPIEEFPKPLFAASEDPIEFASALMYHMRRHGDTDWHLHRAIVDLHPGFERTTLVSWRKGKKSPRTVDSLEVLASFERRYRLRAGYFKAKLPHQWPNSGLNPLGARQLTIHLPWV